MDIGKKFSDLIINTSKMYKIEYKDGIVSRNGDDIDSLTWVFSKDDNVILESDASHEMETDISWYYQNLSGKEKGEYTCYLKAFINGKYQVVSNFISWTH